MPAAQSAVLPGTDHREIREVYSHSQALSQCRRFLSKQSHTGSVLRHGRRCKDAYETKPRAAACIAGRLAAELYSLEILKDNIQDSDVNRTRFLILAREKSETHGTKCSITFTTAHKIGTLFGVLEIFANAGINLTRIESIPTEPGKYSFS